MGKDSEYYKDKKKQQTFFSFFCFASLSFFFFSNRLSIELKPYIDKA